MTDQGAHQLEFNTSSLENQTEGPPTLFHVSNINDLLNFSADLHSEDVLNVSDRLDLCLSVVKKNSTDILALVNAQQRFENDLRMLESKSKNYHSNFAEYPQQTYIDSGDVEESLSSMGDMIKHLQ